MRIAVFGLGYVGAVSSACLARQGHEVIGVDVSEPKVRQINAGSSPIRETGLDELIAEAVRQGRLHATTDSRQALAWADVSLVCVGTPSRPNGSLDIQYVERVICDIGEYLRHKPVRHTVVVRSTLLPGTTTGRLIPLLEETSGKRAGSDIGVAYNPEFLRESTAVRDYFDPPYIVVGGIDDASADTAAALYADLDAPVQRVTISEAEMVKYGANAFHALKITFANEVGNFSKAVGVDSHRVMSLLTQDTKLNISPAYLRPGFAYGGSCLPKDLRALLFAAKMSDVELPMLQSLPRSNALQIQNGVDLVLSQGHRKVGILGFSFKAGTDDLRESPMVHLAETLLGKGCLMKLYDRNVQWGRVVGANKQFITTAIPHICDLMVDTIEEVIEYADVIVIGNNDPEFAAAAQTMRDKIVIDMVGLPAQAQDSIQAVARRFHGICW